MILKPSINQPNEWVMSDHYTLTITLDNHLSEGDIIHAFQFTLYKVIDNNIITGVDTISIKFDPQNNTEYIRRNGHLLSCWDTYRLLHALGFNTYNEFIEQVRVLSENNSFNGYLVAWSKKKKHEN